MKTEDIIRYAAIALGAYLLYKWYQQHQAQPQIVAGAGQSSIQPAQPGQSAQTQPAQTPAAPANAAAQVKARAEADWGANPSLTADQWNFYAKIVLSREMPAPESFGFVGEGRNQAVQFDTYWTRLVGSKTIPGLGWLGWMPAGTGYAWGSGLSGWLT